MPTERDPSNAELVLYFSLDKVLNVTICILIASNMTASFPGFHSSIAKRIYLRVRLILFASFGKPRLPMAFLLFVFYLEVFCYFLIIRTITIILLMLEL